jgi:hypothetical protein
MNNFIKKPSMIDVYISDTGSSSIQNIINDIKIKHIESMSQPYNFNVESDPTDIKNQIPSYGYTQLQYISFTLNDKPKEDKGYILTIIEELLGAITNDIFDTPINNSNHGLDKLYDDLLFMYDINNYLIVDKLDLIIESRCIGSTKSVNIMIDPKYVTVMRKTFIGDKN